MDSSKKKESSWIRQLALFTRGQRLKLGAFAVICCGRKAVGGIVPFLPPTADCAFIIRHLPSVKLGHWALSFFSEWQFRQ